MPDLNASIYAVAAMAGCMWRESTLNPRVWESGIVANWDTVHYYDSQGRGVGGFGLGQWTNTQEAGGVIAYRLRDFYDWTIDNGLNIEDGNTQLQYILHENVWFNVSHVGSNAQTLTDFLTTTSTDLDGLTEDFLANWEGVPGDALSERIQHAHDILDYIRAHQNDDPDTIAWQSSSNYIIPESETLNNSLCFYFYFQGFDPGGGFPGSVTEFVQWCIAKCNEANIGYSQQYREEQTVNGITYYDCSSFVWYGLKHCGFDVDATGHPTYAFDTNAMPTDLPKIGFREINPEDGVRPGDIAVSPTHTEVVYEAGTQEGYARFMGAHSPGLPLDDQVSINSYETSFDYFQSYWRFSSSGPRPGAKGARRRLWLFMRNHRINRRLIK